MPQFLVELYVPRGVALLRSIVVPEDETCFLLFEAPDVEQVEHALRGAGLPFERIAQATEAETVSMSRAGTTVPSGPTTATSTGAPSETRRARRGGVGDR